jgi:Lon protease-like protein
MFPLSSVLLPHMPYPVRIFEERYLVMLARVLQDDSNRFGIVLIERGTDAGGGDARFGTGCVGVIQEVEGEDGAVIVLLRGTERFRIVDRLPDDPHPLATVEYLDELEWDDDLLFVLERAEQIVRRTLALASEYADSMLPADVDLVDEPVARSWQLAGISPLGELDRLTLLRSESLRELLDGIIESTLAVEQTIGAVWGEDPE